MAGYEPLADAPGAGPRRFWRRLTLVGTTLTCVALLRLPGTSPTAVPSLDSGDAPAVDDADDGGGNAPTLSSASLAVNCSAVMPMRLSLTFALAGVSTEGASHRLAAQYAPISSTALAPLWSEAVTTETLTTCDDDHSSLACGSVELYRVRANAEYTVSLWMKALGADDDGAAAQQLWSGTITSCGSGMPQLDATPYVQVDGATPSWAMATFALDEVYVGDSISAQELVADGYPGNKNFAGLVAVDAEGYVVWRYHLWALESWDFLPGGGLVLQADADSQLDSKDVAARTPRASTLTRYNGTDDDDATARARDGGASTLATAANARRRDAKAAAGRDDDADDVKYWTANSQLQQVRADGSLVAQYISSCAGDPLNYNLVSHECRVDTSDARAGAGAGARVLTSRYRGARLPATTVEYIYSRQEGGYSDVSDTFFGSEIVAWDRETNTIEPLYNLFEYASPGSEMFAFPWDSLTGTCSGGASVTGVDYHHVSSIAVGSDSNLVVASRELSTVWSFAHDGSGLQWSLSSSLGCEGETALCFEDDAMAFYTPHDVRQMANGDLLVIDDGTSRPGCFQESEINCFSRVVMYSLDLEAMVARAVWQFSFPLDLGAADWADAMSRDVYNSCGGSAEKLASGNYLVAFTGMSADSMSYHNGTKTRTSYAWEIDADGVPPGADPSEAASVRGPRVRSALKIPIPHWSVGKQNGYRVKTWTAIAGESTTDPL